MPYDLILSLCLLYVFAVFVASRIVVPHLGFRKERLLQRIPNDMQLEIIRLRKKSSTKDEFLKNVYSFLTKRYYGATLQTFICFDYLYKGLEWVWSHPGFMPCTQLNYLLRHFLVRGGYFSENDIKIRHTFLNLDIHQYASVNLGGKWVDVDLWANFAGKKLGEHAGF